MYGLVLLAALGATTRPVASLDLFPNFNTLGVNVRLTTPDPEKDATATLEYASGADKLVAGFPLSRVDGDFEQLSGCVFWCRPGTEYFVRVTLHDVTTPVLDGTVLEGRGSTRQEPMFSVPAKTLYVSPTGRGTAFTQVSPGALSDAIAHIEGSQRLVLLEGRYDVGDLRLNASGTGAQPLIIEGEAGKQVILDHCVFGINDIGVMLAGNCRHITIQDCDFFDAMTGWHAWKIKASYDNYAPYSAIFPFYSRMLERGGLLYQHGFHGRGIVVRRCRFHDFAQAGHLGPPSRNDMHSDSYEIDFHDNRVWNCAEDGFELDGDARNVRIWGNEFHHCNASLSLAVAQGGPIYVLRNVFHSIVPDIFTMRPEDGLRTQSGHPFKFQTGDTKSRVGDLYFIHNTINAPDNAIGMELIAPARWKRFQARNNLIVSDKAEALVVHSFESFPTDLDYNGYFTRRGGRLGSIDTNTRDGQPATPVKTIFELHKLGWEKHGLSADPQFLDPDKHDYRLRASSPAIDRGEILDGLNAGRFSGRAPDLGAFELPATPERP